MCFVQRITLTVIFMDKIGAIPVEQQALQTALATSAQPSDSFSEQQ